jgi:hypothetical protein
VKVQFSLLNPGDLYVPQVLEIVLIELIKRLALAMGIGEIDTMDRNHLHQRSSRSSLSRKTLIRYTQARVKKKINPRQDAGVEKAREDGTDLLPQK